MFWVGIPQLSVIFSHWNRVYNLFSIVILYWSYKSITETYLQVLWLVPRWVSIYKYYAVDDIKRYFVFPLFYKENRGESSLFTMFWLFHPILSGFYYLTTPGIKRSWIVLLYWYKNNGDVWFQLFWLVPQWVSVYKYFRSVDYDITRYFVFPILYKEKIKDRNTTALLWLFHPFAACYHNCRTSVFHRVWLFPVFWYRKVKNNFQPGNLFSQDSEKYFQLLWLVPRWISAFKYYSNESLSRHFLFLVYYREKSQEHSLYALLWFFHPMASCYQYMITSLFTRIWLFPVFFSKKCSDYSQ
jgi:hypothetical protein